RTWRTRTPCARDRWNCFEDDRVPFADWAWGKADTQFGGLPLLERDGEVVARSNGINPYVGKLAKKAQRQALVEARSRSHLTRLQQRLDADGGRYFGGDR